MSNRFRCKEKGCSTITARKHGRQKYCKEHGSPSQVQRRSNQKRKKNARLYSKHLGVRRIWAAKWRKKNKETYRERQNASNLRLKVLVLSLYGKKGKPVCKWRGCFVSDLDMLTLDHIANDGKKHRASGLTGGIDTYRHVKNSGFPDGFQTLCLNHQFKKEMVRRRGQN